MKEYIDREAFITAKRKQYCADCDRRKGMKRGKLEVCYDIGDAPCRSCGIGDMLDDVENFPAADVVEVVLCKDCKHCKLVRDAANWSYVICLRGRNLAQCCDWFCADGEREDDA